MPANSFMIWDEFYYYQRRTNGYQLSDDDKAFVQRIMRGEHGGIHFHPLKGSQPRIYSAYYNDKVRFLFIAKKNQLILAEIMTDHQYDTAYIAQPGVARRLFNLDFDTLKEKLTQIQMSKPSEEGIPDEITPNPDYVYQESFAASYHENFITLTDKQNNYVKSIELPAIISGAPGSGKTVITHCGLTQDAQHLPLEETDQYIAYFTLSPGLAERMKNQWMIDNPATAGLAAAKKILFIDYSFVLENYAPPHLKTYEAVGQTAFEAHLKTLLDKEKKLKRTPLLNDPQFIEIIKVLYHEMQIIAGCLTPKAYLAPDTISNIPASRLDIRAYALTIYNDYIKKINEREQYDPNLLIWKPQNKPFLKLYFDEAQTGSPAIKYMIHQLSEKILYCIDSNQATAQRVSDVNNIISKFNTQGKPLPFHELDSSHRLPPVIADVANQVLAIKQHLCGGIIEKHQAYKIKSSELEGMPTGYVEVIETSKLDELVTKLKKLNCAYIVITRECWKKEAIARFGNDTLILNIEESRGLEFETVITYRTAKTTTPKENELKIEGVLKSKPAILENKPHLAKNGKGDNTHAAYCTEQYVPYTRTRNELYIIEDKQSIRQSFLKRIRETAEASKMKYFAKASDVELTQCELIERAEEDLRHDRIESAKARYLRAGVSLTEFDNILENEKIRRKNIIDEVAAKKTTRTEIVTSNHLESLNTKPAGNLTLDFIHQTMQSITKKNGETPEQETLPSEKHDSGEANTQPKNLPRLNSAALREKMNALVDEIFTHNTKKDGSSILARKDVEYQENANYEKYNEFLNIILRKDGEALKKALQKINTLNWGFLLQAYGRESKLPLNAILLYDADLREAFLEHIKTQTSVAKKHFFYFVNPNMIVESHHNRTNIEQKHCPLLYGLYTSKIGSVIVLEMAAQKDDFSNTFFSGLAIETLANYYEYYDNTDHRFKFLNVITEAMMLDVDFALYLYKRNKDTLNRLSLEYWFLNNGMKTGDPSWSLFKEISIRSNIATMNSLKYTELVELLMAHFTHIINKGGCEIDLYAIVMNSGHPKNTGDYLNYLDYSITDLLLTNPNLRSYAAIFYTQEVLNKLSLSIQTLINHFFGKIISPNKKGGTFLTTRKELLKGSPYVSAFLDKMALENTNDFYYAFLRLSISEMNFVEIKNYLGHQKFYPLFTRADDNKSSPLLQILQNKKLNDHFMLHWLIQLKNNDHSKFTHFFETNNLNKTGCVSGESSKPLWFYFFESKFSVELMELCLKNRKCRDALLRRISPATLTTKISKKTDGFRRDITFPLHCLSNIVSLELIIKYHPAIPNLFPFFFLEPIEFNGTSLSHLSILTASIINEEMIEEKWKYLEIICCLFERIPQAIYMLSVDPNDSVTHHLLNALQTAPIPLIQRFLEVLTPNEPIIRELTEKYYIKKYNLNSLHDFSIFNEKSGLFDDRPSEEATITSAAVIGRNSAT